MTDTTRSMHLHKYPPAQLIDELEWRAIHSVQGLRLAVDILERGSRHDALTLGDFDATLWRCRMADVDWAYGETWQVAFVRARDWWMEHDCPEWSTDESKTGKRLRPVSGTA